MYIFSFELKQIYQFEEFKIQIRLLLVLGIYTILALVIYLLHDWPRGYKTFYTFISVEHEILNAHKYKKISRNSAFFGSDKPGMLFFMLMNKGARLWVIL